ncbi:MAG: hypothetical protein ACI4QR_01550, partial [Eubacteriales bacterium]
ISLKQDIEQSLMSQGDFASVFMSVCRDVVKYRREYPYSAESVDKFNADTAEIKNISDTVKHIFALGTEINNALAAFIESGKKSGALRCGTESMMSVYVIWSAVNSLVGLVQTKGKFLSKELDVTEEDFLEYGFRMLLNSILENRIQ